MSKKSGIITLASLSLLMAGCGDSSQVPSSNQNDRTSQAEQPSQHSGGSNGNNKHTMDKSERMEMQQPSFSQLDSDGNGSISKEEAQAFEDLALYFKQLDRNKDNKIDSDEFRNFKAMQMRSFDHGGDSGAEYGEHGALSTQKNKSATTQEQ
ncbi:EF-hand domain-containing protein [Nitrosococcus oceani]|nr:EF-hand domain-containing protein [Nitrosococcus oceani]EDZ65911.1 hypothetical protein NOC27_2591 [Nitrosococcus oceani AFC27]GEM20554.1 calcium sensor EFh [Nitrosococcus oceani]